MEQIGNLFGQKSLSSMTEVTNTRQFMTAIILNWQLQKYNHQKKVRKCFDQIQSNGWTTNNKHWLYSMFVVFQHEGCTTAPLPEYANNQIFQELPKKRNYFTNTDENSTLT